MSQQEQCEPALVRFYLYATGSSHKFHITGDWLLFAYWRIRTSPLFYSVVEQGHMDPPSLAEEIRKIQESDRKIQESDRKMQESVQESDRRIRRLEMNSSTAGIRDRVFSECVEVSLRLEEATWE